VVSKENHLPTGGFQGAASATMANGHRTDTELTPKNARHSLFLNLHLERFILTIKSSTLNPKAQILETIC